MHSFAPCFCKVGSCRLKAGKRCGCACRTVAGNDGTLAAAASGKNSHLLGCRLSLSCTRAFKSGRSIKTVLMCLRESCGRGTPTSFCTALPMHGRNVTKHVACTCSGGCVVRTGFKCGNDRGFKRNGHFNFFPSMTINCGVSGRGFFAPLEGIISGLGVENSCNGMNGSSASSHFPCLACMGLSKTSCAFNGS